MDEDLSQAKAATDDEESLEIYEPHQIDVEEDMRSLKATRTIKKTKDAKKFNRRSKQVIKYKEPKVYVSKNTSKKAAKHFDFFFARTCFRYMNEFYKHKFSNFGARLSYSLPYLNLMSRD